MRGAVVLFTRDLRVRDNPALHAAVLAPGPTTALFVYDDEALVRHQSQNRREFLDESLADLSDSLGRVGIDLKVVRSGRSWVEEVRATATDADASVVHQARDYSGFAARRSARLRTELARHQVDLVQHEGIAVVAPGRLRPSGRDHYAVFTPFYRRWRETDWGRPLPAPEPVGGNGSKPHPTDPQPTDPQPIRGSTTPLAREPGGERHALQRLARWAATDLDDYERNHDALGPDRTSRISAALHFGCLSPREVAVRLADRPGGEGFVRQLAWRDFFLQVLAARPETASADVRSRSFAWRSNVDDFEAWCVGRTGFPIVDAAMRQLRSEGFVHNRARMVAASFLTKDLAIDWRHGAAEYLRWLTDGDVAQNQLNWQWVAGTGTDSNPHRIFNPVLQSRRFDADGAYIRRYVTELRDVPTSEIHDPGPMTRAAVGYPPPLVDHATAISEYRARGRQ
jgi:deoxyribodipyrimidine photo-lyase